MNSKQQLAVYNGRETSRTDCYSSGNRVYFYPTEYLTYGYGSSALLTTRPNGNQEYKVTDHLGSTRVVVDSTGYILSQYDYEPFGKPLAKTGLDSRKSFIDKEKDYESGLADHGVRKYDYEGGIFRSIDPLWEKYRGWSPYQYSMNNPINFLDINGMDVFIDHDGKLSGEGKLRYENRRLTNQDGTDYTGNNKFVLETKSYLDRLHDIDNVGIQARLKRLETDGLEHDIQEFEEYSSFTNTTEPQTAQDTDEFSPVGSIVHFGPKMAKLTGNDPFEILAHEVLGHSWDLSWGIRDYSQSKVIGVNNCEINALNIQNLVNIYTGISIKYHYDRIPIPDEFLWFPRRKK